MPHTRRSAQNLFVIFVFRFGRLPRIACAAEVPPPRQGAPPRDPAICAHLRMPPAPRPAASPFLFLCDCAEPPPSCSTAAAAPASGADLFPRASAMNRTRLISHVPFIDTANARSVIRNKPSQSEALARPSAEKQPRRCAPALAQAPSPRRRSSAPPRGETAAPHRVRGTSTPLRHTPARSVLGSWGKTMRDAIRNKVR